jgi:SAM-dependent methyltransferase
MSLQQFSLFHETSEKDLKAWHRPYAAIFAGQSPVLDIGCGPSYFADVLLELGIDSLGIDLDPAMVEMSITRGRRAVLGTQNSLPETDGGFGGVHVSHVIEHLWGDELETLLVNANRALRPGGILVLRTPNWENRFVRERLFWMDHTHKRPYPRELLVRMLRDLGMTQLTSGAEPFGMNDTYVVAAKPSLENKEAIRVQFSGSQNSQVTTVRRIKGRIKNRLRSFLEIG